MFLRFFCFSLLFCLITQTSAGEKCRALVLEGGGDKGAYQAGALSELFALIPSEIQYDVISGVSVGALNAAALAQFAKGDEGNMTSFLLDIWTNIQSSDVFQDWPGGIIDGIIFRPSIYDTSPLTTFLEQHFTRDLQRKVSIGTCNANNGTFVRFHEDLSRADLITAVKCSSAIPAIFPYVEFQGETYIDGGSVLNLDVDGAVERCREMTDSDADIIVDVILCTGAHLNDVVQEGDKTLQMLSRYLSINSYLSALDDLLHAYDDNPDIDFRYVIMPSSPLPSGEIPLDFDPAEIQTMIALGRNDTQTVVSKGSVNMTEIRETVRSGRKRAQKRH